MEFYPNFFDQPKPNTVKIMTELEKYELVNQCETQSQLEDAINKLADSEGMIQGRERNFDASKMILGLQFFMDSEAPANVLTREYGIRQQAIYLKTFNK